MSISCCVLEQSKQLALGICWTLYSWSNADIPVLLSKQSCVPQFCQWSDKLLSRLNLLLMTPALGPSSCFSHYCTYGSSTLSMACENLLLSYMCVFMCFRSLCHAFCQQDDAYTARHWWYVELVNQCVSRCCDYFSF